MDIAEGLYISNLDKFSNKFHFVRVQKFIPGYIVKSADLFLFIEKARNFRKLGSVLAKIELAFETKSSIQIQNKSNIFRQDF